MRRSKYNNVKTVVDGIKFDSKREASRYGELKLLEKSGDIFNLQLQPKYTFEINNMILRNEKKSNGAKGAPVSYTADFRYKVETLHHLGDKPIIKLIIEDSKGFKTDIYKIKKALMLAVHGIEVFET